MRFLVAGSAVVVLLLFGARTARAADIGYAGALGVVRTHLKSWGYDPEGYVMRLDEDLCERTAGRCYYVVLWAKARESDENDGFLQYWISPTTGLIDTMGIVD